MKRIVLMTVLLSVAQFLGAELSFPASPVAVSPGVEEGTALVGQVCPTFSWSQVEGAMGYEVMVFDSPMEEALSHEESALNSEPLLRREVRAPALSWTPSGRECLKGEKSYIWYVGAIHGEKEALWSQGKVFRVDSSIMAAEMKPMIREAVEEVLVTTDIMTESVGVLEKRVKEEVLKEVREKTSAAPKAMEGTNNTFYGFGAGETIFSEGGTGKYNAFFGAEAGYATNDGFSNTFLGYRAGRSNITGDLNTFIGNEAGYSNTASYNTFIGYYAGRTNSTGDENTFTGYYAGYSNTGGAYNTFSGLSAGHSNTTGSYNTCSGRKSGYFNVSGDANTFTGSEAGYSNISGRFNTFTGLMAGYSNTTGSYNTFTGAASGYNNKHGTYNTFTGYSAGLANTTGSENTFSGYQAGYSNSMGSENTFSGYQAGYYNTYGSYNTFSGYQAGFFDASGFDNTFSGYQAGFSGGSFNTYSGCRSGRNNTGFYNTFIGFQTGFSSTNGYANTYLGYEAGYSNISGLGNVFLGWQAGYHETGNGKLYIHNSSSSPPLIYGEFTTRILTFNAAVTATSLTCTSDLSLKKNVQPLNSSLEKVGNLRGVSYEWRTEDHPDRGLKEGRHIGLIAQEVEEVLPELVQTDKDGYKSLAYDKMVAVLVEAMKEQQGQIEKQRGEIEDLRRMIQELKARPM